MKVNSTIETSRDTDLRLRILSYHVQTLATMPPGRHKSTLCTVAGFECDIERLEDGTYLINGRCISNLQNAIGYYFELLSPHVTGIHADND